MSGPTREDDRAPERSRSGAAGAEDPAEFSAPDGGVVAGGTDSVAAGGTDSGGRRGKPAAPLRFALRVTWIVVVAALAAIMVAFIVDQAFLARVMTSIFPGVQEAVYGRATLGKLLADHLVLVAVSSVAAAVVGIPLGVFVTRPSGKPFLTLVQDLSSLAQTIPPVAVLALAVPALGFGFKPAVTALFLYSILPIINNTISGIQSVSPLMVEASRGMGMTRMQTLFRTELPLAARVMAAGVRTSVVINVGTATIGAVAGAGGLGVAIVAGLVRNNLANVLEGAVTAAFLALTIDWLFSRVERLFYAPQDRSAQQ